MASGGEDQTLILWDLGTGKRLKTMTGHTGFIYTVSFSSDSTVLVSGSADGTVRVWDVNKNTPYDHSNDEPDTKRTKYEKSTAKQLKDKKEMDKAKSIADSKRKKGALERYMHIYKRELIDKLTCIDFLNSNDHLSVFPTKNTPIYTVRFTQRNLCLAAGALNSPILDM
jgi:transcription initiation factor TFIID subunit 5